MPNEEQAFIFRFQLRNGTSTPTVNDVEEYEPFIYKDNNNFYYFGCRVGNSIKTCQLIGE